MSDRSTLMEQLRKRYIPTRVSRVEPEYIEFEEETISDADLKRLVAEPLSSLPNPHNSVLLYICGVTDQIDFIQRVDTIGGSPPDIDSDFDTQGYPKLIEWLIEHYGREQVTNILAVQKFKPRGVARKFYSVTAPEDETELPAHLASMKEVLECIPDDLFGKSPSIQECIEGNEKKGYQPHPQLLQPKHKRFVDTAKYLEGMVSTYSVHACGYVIANEPISNIIPIGLGKIKDDVSGQQESRWVVQATMEELEQIGLSKFDFLRIENLSIVKECVKLIKDRHGIVVDPYRIEDGDTKAYDLIAEGKIGGVFQLEASTTTRDYAMRMKPKSIDEIGIISALVRPGGLQSGMADAYIRNMNNGYPPEDMPQIFVDLLKDTYWVMAYQEQLIQIVNQIAGFSLAESDGIRRAVGKKKTDKILPYRKAFIAGCMERGVSEEYAEHFWDKIIVGQSDYQFNKSHSVAYSYLTYVCAWLKANYPIEFFTALMSVRSQVLQPQKWADKAPVYVQEARSFGIKIHLPDINKSAAGFTISPDSSTIYFGLGSIRKVGAGASRLIEHARNNTPFKDIKDFFNRIDKSKINIGVFGSLVGAGCFDSLGYQRGDLLAAAELFYEWYKWRKDCEERTVKNAMRQIENVEIQKLIEERDVIRKRSKKKGYEPTQEELDFLEQNKRLALHRELAMPAEPLLPDLQRHTKISLSIEELLVQGELIGCYIINPVRIVYPNTTPISKLEDMRHYDIAGIVGEIKTYKNQRGNTTYVTIFDGTGSIKIPFWPGSTIPIPKKGNLIHVSLKGGRPPSLEDDDDIKPIKVSRVLSLTIYEGATS